MASIVEGGKLRSWDGKGRGGKRLVHIAIDCIVCFLLVLHHRRFAPRMEDASPLMWCSGWQHDAFHDYACEQD